ncbi:hypothetical protein PBCVNEJV1_639R [Paramecium bursaria Chlorella virus NE-JV-1]|nr:hypothetical protein PBCVNEJV1_639R [Paramecium bursaria Chlorella virus NE-JV-1]
MHCRLIPVSYIVTRVYICARYHLKNNKMRFFGAFLAVCTLFASAHARPVELVNNCEYDTFGFVFQAVDEKFVQDTDSAVDMFVEIDRGIQTVNVGNDSYIEIADPTIDKFFDESGYPMFVEEVQCDLFENALCPDLKVPSRFLLYVGDIDTVFMCRVGRESDFKIVNRCPFDVSMYVFHSDDGAIAEYEIDVLESDWSVSQNSTVFVEKKKNLTLLEFAPSIENAQIMYYDKNDDFVSLVIYTCGELSPKCGKYAETTVKLVDVTSLDALYLCA